MQVPQDIRDQWIEETEKVIEEIEKVYPYNTKTANLFKHSLLLVKEIAFHQGVNCQLVSQNKHYQELLEIEDTDDEDEDGNGRDGLPKSRPPEGSSKIPKEDLESLEKLWNDNDSNI